VRYALLTGVRVGDLKPCKDSAEDGVLPPVVDGVPTSEALGDLPRRTDIKFTMLAPSQVSILPVRLIYSRDLDKQKRACVLRSPSSWLLYTRYAPLREARPVRATDARQHEPRVITGVGAGRFSIRWKSSQ
jgi:hypothetical protein